MSLLTDPIQRCRGVFRGGREDAETQEELQFHLEMETEKNLGGHRFAWIPTENAGREDRRRPKRRKSGSSRVSPPGVGDTGW